MERTRLAISVGASPIVEAVGGVAVLLNFGDNCAWSEGVDGACGQVDGVTGSNGYTMEHRIDGAGGGRVSKAVAVDTGFESIDDFCIGLGVEDDP